MARTLFSKATEAVVSVITQTPSLESASAALDACRTDMVTAQEAHSNAAIALDDAHLADDVDKILAAESTLASAETTRDRAQRRLAAAESRFQVAKINRDTDERLAARATLDGLLDKREEGAKLIDAGALQIAAGQKLIAEANEPLHILMARKLVPSWISLDPAHYKRICELALMRVRAVPVVYLGDAASIPSAVDSITKDNATLKIAKPS